MVDDDQPTTVDEHEEEEEVEGTGTTALRVKTDSWWLGADSERSY